MFIQNLNYIFALTFQRGLPPTTHQITSGATFLARYMPHPPKESLSLTFWKPTLTKQLNVNSDEM
jgi:hypothetical protein